MPRLEDLISGVELMLSTSVANSRTGTAAAHGNMAQPKSTIESVRQGNAATAVSARKTVQELKTGKGAKILATLDG